MNKLSFRNLRHLSVPLLFNLHRLLYTYIEIHKNWYLYTLKHIHLRNTQNVRRREDYTISIRCNYLILCYQNNSVHGMTTMRDSTLLLFLATNTVRKMQFLLYLCVGFIRISELRIAVRREHTSKCLRISTTRSSFKTVVNRIAMYLQVQQCPSL